MNKYKWQTDLDKYLPEEIKRPLFALTSERAGALEEIRIRVYKPIQIICGGTNELLENEIIDEKVCVSLLERICDYSPYSCERERRQGFITLYGGYRIGLCGRMGSADTLGRVCGFNIRIAKEWKDCAKGLIPHISGEDGKALSTLLVSAPGVGKTTMLRDIARLLSDGGEFRAHKVAVADERSEIAGSYLGVPTLDVGIRTDVMDGWPKSQAVQMLIRTMSPDVIVTDEIGGAQDAAALGEAAKCGVSVIASAHARDAGAAKERPELASLMRAGMFERVVELSRDEKGVSFHVA